MIRHATQRPVVSVFVALVFLAASANLFAQTVTLQFGAQLPANSPYANALQKLAAEWSRISNGRVRLVFPRTAANSSQDDLIQKMKFQLDGALLDAVGLAILYPDSLLLSVPSLIRTDAEYEAARAAALPPVRAAIGDRYELLGFSRGGWLHLFSGKPVRTPEDFRGSRFPADRTSDVMFSILQSIGVHTVKSDAASILLQLNSKTIDCIFTSPVIVGVLWSQYRRFLPYMTGVRLAPFLGAVVFTRRAWDRVPPELRPGLAESLDRVLTDMMRDSLALEESAVAAMSRDGLSVTAADASADAAWATLLDRKRLHSYFTPDFVDTVLASVQDARRNAR